MKFEDVFTELPTFEYNKFVEHKYLKYLYAPVVYIFSFFYIMLNLMFYVVVSAMDLFCGIICKLGGNK